MKQILLLSLFICSIHALQITKTKTFLADLETNSYTTSFSLHKQAKTQNEIEKLFAQAIRFVDNTTICSTGGYSIIPNYTYSNGKREFDGYRSNINFTCNLNKEQKNIYESLLNNMKSLNVKLSQNKLTPSLQKKEINIRNLENKAYKYSKEYTTYLNTIYSNCTISQITFDPNDNNRIQPFAFRSSSAEQTSVSLPVNENIQLKLTVQFQFSCKN